MRKIFTLCVLTLLFGLKGVGQVSSYVFAQSSNVYSSITGTALSFSGTTTAWDDNVVSLTIPFNYTFNGTTYTSCSVNSNGYLTFGTTASSTTGYTPISATTAYNGAVSAFGRDLINNSISITYTTLNSSPNRVFVIQWNNARRYNGGAVTGDVLNFQIRLYETSNKAEVIYGTCTATSTTALPSQVGLRGASNADYNNRLTTTNWSATTAGAANTANCTSTNAIMPASGLTFTWTPPSPPANDNCAGAVSITPGTTCVATSGTTAGATQQFAPSLCSGFTSSTANDVWYSFVADGVSSYTINVTGVSTFDPVLQLLSGCSLANAISCIDGTTGGGTETISAGVLTAGTYYYRIYGYGGSSGNFTTCVTYPPPCSGPPTQTNTGTYFTNISCQTARTNFNNNSVNSGYADYYSTQSCSALAGDIINFSFTLTGSTLGSGGAVYVDWNNDGSFSLSERIFTTNGYTIYNSNPYVPIQIPSTAPTGDHRMRFIVDYNSTNPAACSFASGGRGEAEDYKITILSTWSCSSAASSSNNTFNITQIKLVGTLSDPPANNTGVGLASGYSDYTGLSNKATQEQGEAVNVVSTVTNRSDLAAWVDWNNDGIFTTPGEMVYRSPNVIFQSTTFGFQIPLGTAPGNYKLRIRSYNWLDDVSAPYATIYPCGSYYNGETEDYLFTVITRCTARIASVLNDDQCNTTGTMTNFTLSATGTSGVTGFKWYSALTGGSQVGSSTASGSPPTGTFNTAVNTTTTYWVTATNGTCETPLRIPVVANLRPIPTITFSPSKSTLICNGASLGVSGTSSTETAYLINEGFEGGSLGVFTGSTTGTIANSFQNWTNQSSIYTPSGSSIFWQPSISSGFGPNKFVLAYSLAPGNSNTYKAFLTSTNSYNTNTFTSLSLDFKVYYDHYLADNLTTYMDSLRVEASSNNGSTWTKLDNKIADAGNASNFQTISYNLNSYTNLAQLKIRFIFNGELDASLGVAIDSVRLYGDRPASNSYIWTQVGGYIDNQYRSLYTTGNVNDTAANPYTGGSATNVYLFPTDAQGDDGTPLKFETRLDLSNGCTVRDTITVDVNDKIWTAAAGSKDWSDKFNWCGNKVPAPSDRIKVPYLGAGANYPKIPLIYVAKTKFLTIDSGASVTIDSTATLQIRGDLVTSMGGFFTNNGTLEIIGADNGVAQNFPGSGTIAEMNNLTIDNSKTPENGNNVILNAPISIAGNLKPSAGIFALGNNDITIKSKASGTGYVSALGATAGFNYNGSGRFVIERYIPAKRAWRFLSVPVSSAQTINAAWQEGNVNPDKNCLNNNATPVGYGTEITYYSNGGSGFDPNITSNPSIKYWDSSANNWVAPTSTYVPLNSRAAYCLFVRGDRTICLDGINPAKSTVLRTRGVLNQGTKIQSFGSIASGNHIMIGNPYPSPVDFNKIKTTFSGIIPNYFYVWDPKIGGTFGVGKYVTYSTAGAGSWSDNSGSYPSGTLPVFQSGQAFFVQSNSTAGSITFNENSKTNTEFSVNRLKPSAVLHAQVLLPDDSLKVADAVCVIFDNRYSKSADEFDAPKLWNFEGENMALVRDNNTLSIETRPKPKSTDTVFFRMYLKQGQGYVLNVYTDNIADNITGKAWLIDKYLSTETEVNLFDTTLYSFTTILNDTLSYRNRFMLVFNRSNYNPVASKETNKISVDAGNVKVFPNPVVKHSFTMQLKNREAGRYEALIYDAKGVIVLNKSIQHTGKNSDYKIIIPGNVTAGIYKLVVNGSGGTVQAISLVVAN